MFSCKIFAFGSDRFPLCRYTLSLKKKRSSNCMAKEYKSNYLCAKCTILQYFSHWVSTSLKSDTRSVFIKGRFTSKIKYRRFPSYLLCTLLLFSFHLLPSPVHPTVFSFCFFSGFLAIFILLSSNKISKA